MRYSTRDQSRIPVANAPQETPAVSRPAAPAIIPNNNPPNTQSRSATDLSIESCGGTANRRYLLSSQVRRAGAWNQLWQPAALQNREPEAPCAASFPRSGGLALISTIDTLLSPVEALNAPYDRERLEDVGYLTCMTLVLLGNYAQTGHFGGPLAYTPYNVAVHLAGPGLGGLRYDYRQPKHPYGDKFMLAGGHCIPTCYALWMIMGQALARRYAMT